MAPDHQQPPQPPKKNVDQHRKLRIVAICTFIPALALLLPCGIISGKPLPTIGIAPMFFSAAFQAATINGRPRLPMTTFCINVFLAAFLFSILLPRSVDWDFPTLAGVRIADLFFSDVVGSSWPKAGYRTGIVTV